MSSPRSVIESVLLTAWQRRGVIACLLWPLSFIFNLLIVTRLALYALGIFRITILPVPVIVVGNIFVGGTGKTPLVIWIIQLLQEQGWKPAVISRGYGSSAQQVRAVEKNSHANEVGDEPLLIAKRTGVPVFIGRDRAAAGLALLQAHPNVNIIISDDGLQHYALGRNIEIQLSDSRGNGNGWLLPAGPLREPATRQSDFYVVNTSEESAGDAYTMQLVPVDAERLLDRTQRKSLRDFSFVQSVAAVAGIGHPERFFTTLRSHGISLTTTQALPDHFDYATNPFADIEASAILITEKDAVKCMQHNAIANDVRIWVVPVQAHVDASLAKHILEKLHG
ncbi:MAG: tetraacyldisaccharide 4'-kinase [Burkholderiales bacterium]|nr:tetraacyldisaccharide 4'-kinase [Burkholderiales bacterium]